jgi:hypothetical protein
MYVSMVIGRYNNSGDLPRGFVWDENGVKICTYRFSILIEKIYALRERNGGDLAPEWIERVADDLCDKYKIQKCPPKPANQPVRKIRLGDISRFLKTVKNWMASGGVPVDPSEANRRAEICSKCPMNVDVSGCLACKKLVSSLFPSLKGLTTDHDAELEGCAGCGCQLKMKVWLPFEVLPDGLEDAEMYHEDCWIRKELLASEAQ